jgi:hypothetical protein
MCTPAHQKGSPSPGCTTLTCTSIFRAAGPLLSRIRILHRGNSWRVSLNSFLISPLYSLYPESHLQSYFCKIMAKDKEKYSFWTKYKKFAGNEILLYVIMIVGIILGLIIFSKK